MSSIKRMRQGLGFLFRGFTYLSAHPRLWPWAILPTLINLILFAAALGLFIHYFGDLYGWLSVHLGLGSLHEPLSWWQHIINAMLWAVNLVFQIFIVLLCLILILIISYGLGFIIAGPFNDLLSEKVELSLTGQEEPPFAFRKFLRDLWRTIKVETVKALILLAIPVVLFVVSFIPFIGGPLYAALTFLFGAWDLGFAYAELPLGRKASTFADRKAFAWKHRWTLVGLGAGFAIPFFSLIFAAPMVVGGTILFVETQGPKPSVSGLPA